MIATTVIVSVYRDVEALALILYALAHQSVANFSVVISQDGDDPALAEQLQRLQLPFQWCHLTQSDEGFRKNRALNRAIAAAEGEWLIFIDGDCVPHVDFVSAHQHHAAVGVMTAGRRVELGARWSDELRRSHPLWHRLNRLPHRWLESGSLYRDGARGLEMALAPAPLIQPLNRRPLPLLGCNFAAHRADLIAINGFDERYCAAGFGEDSDLDGRLQRFGVRCQNVKYRALQWHLAHPRRYVTSEQNRALLQQATEQRTIWVDQGLNQYLNSRSGELCVTTG